MVRTGPLLACCMLLGAALALWISAYQVPFHLTLEVGGSRETRRRFDDQPFFSGINGSEPGDQLDDPANPGARLWWWEYLERYGGRPYRWTKSLTTLTLPGAGGHLALVRVLASGPPGGVVSVWEAGPELDYRLELPEGSPRRYHLLAATNAAGDLRLTMQTPPFVAPGDPRELGFVLYEVRVDSAGRPPQPPAWGQLGWLSLSLVAVWLWIAAAAGHRSALAGASLAALLAGYLLVQQRLALTMVTPLLAGLAMVGAAVSLAGRAFDHHRAREGAARLAPLLALIAAAFALRVIGMLHPHAIYSDSGLQANKLLEASLGQIFLSTGLPSGAGGGRQPYPPGPFIVLMPLQLLAPAGHAMRVIVMQVGTALLDSLSLAMIWLILRRAGPGTQAALFGAAGYLLPVSALESFAVGELANLGGQALAIPLITMLALGFAAPQSCRRAVLLLSIPLSGPALSITLTVALTVALLAHSGVTLSVGALVAMAWLMALFRRPRELQPPVGGRELGLAAAIGLGLALLLFYSAPIYLEQLALRQGGAGGRSLAAILLLTAQGVLGIIPPGERSLAVPTLLSLAAFGGLGLLWVRRAAWPGAGALRATLAAWWASVLLGQGLLLVADQSLRWGLFLYPALCLSAGPLLASLWRRGRTGRIVAVLVLAAIIVYGLGRWIVQVRDYYHL